MLVLISFIHAIGRRLPLFHGRSHTASAEIGDHIPQLAGTGQEPTAGRRRCSQAETVDRPIESRHHRNIGTVGISNRHRFDISVDIFIPRRRQLRTFQTIEIHIRRSPCRHLVRPMGTASLIHLVDKLRHLPVLSFLPAGSLFLIRFSGNEMREPALKRNEKGAWLPTPPNTTWEKSPGTYYELRTLVFRNLNERLAAICATTDTSRRRRLQPNQTPEPQSPRRRLHSKARCLPRKV